MKVREAIVALRKIDGCSDPVEREDLLRILARSHALPEIIDSIILATLLLPRGSSEADLDRKISRLEVPR